MPKARYLRRYQDTVRMSASSRLAVEMWQTILRYAIAVPDFLDPDAFEGVLPFYQRIPSTSPINDEAVYWRAENTRIRLQRVSKSWDAYMRRFEHRFVRVLDVCHEKFAPQKLQKAARISFGMYKCWCGICFHEPNGHVGRIRDILNGLESMEMVIVDLKGQWSTALLTPHSSKLQNLKVVIACKFIGYDHGIGNFVGSLPSLRHLHAEEYRGPKLHANQAVISHNLVTAAFSIRTAGEYNVVALELPSLRHLRLDIHGEWTRRDLARPTILSILRVLGCQLLSFHLCYSAARGDSLDGVWDLCPRMESFRTDFSIKSPPTISHPIHTLIFRHSKQLKGLRPSVAEWPNLRKIVLLWTWSELVELGIVVSSLRKNIRVEDEGGVTLDEHYAIALANT